MSFIPSQFLRRSSLVLALAAALPLAACGGDDDGTSPSDAEIAEQWLEQIDAGADASVDIVAEDAPSSSGGPDVSASLTGAFITGGTTLLTIEGDAFDGLILALAGIDGYIDVDYDASRSSADIAVTLYGDVPDTEFSLRIAATDGESVGEYVTIPVEVVEVGAGGPIQVSVSWNTPTDVDLHVVDPNGEEIYYGHSFSDATGGELDLDSNAACGIDGVNNENITWTDEDDPVRGEYIVRVDYWDSCDIVGSTSYVVTVRVEGEDTRTFTGTLSGAGTHGGEGDGVTVTTFDY